MSLASDAVKIALDHVGHGIYQLGTGNKDTPKDAPFDCAGFAICKCYGLRRHRPGFNKGPWASVEDDINCNSAIEDAYHKQELFVPVYPLAIHKDWFNAYSASAAPRPGDLLTYPTFYLNGKDGKKRKFIGHVAIVVDVPAEWEWGTSPWEDLIVVQCLGPNGRKPGIIQSNAAHWDAHDRVWPKPEHRSVLIRRKAKS